MSQTLRLRHGKGHRELDQREVDMPSSSRLSRRQRFGHGLLVSSLLIASGIGCSARPGIGSGQGFGLAGWSKSQIVFHRPDVSPVAATPLGIGKRSESDSRTAGSGNDLGGGASSIRPAGFRTDLDFVEPAGPPHRLADGLPEPLAARAATAEQRASMSPDDGAYDGEISEWTLDQIISACLANDPLLRAGFQEIAAAQADVTTASLKPNPELEVIQSLLPLFRSFIADEREGGPPQLDVAISYPIDWYLFGKRAAAMRSAAAEVEVSRAEYADLIRQRVLEASLAYYEVMEAQSLLELARQDTENLMAVERIVALAVDNEATPRVELSRIRLDRLNSQQALRQAERDLRTAQAELLAVIGGGISLPMTDWDFRVRDDLQDRLEAGDLEWELENVDQLWSIAEANRPDIQALGLRIQQTQLEIESQRREGYRELTPMLGYTRQFQQRAIGQPDADSFGFGLAMTLPINDRNQGNVALAGAQWRRSQFELQTALVELRSEVAAVKAELEASRINSQAIAEEQLRLAEEVRDSIRQAYEAGGRPLIDVLDSQRNFRETYGNYITSRADYLRAIQRFNAVMGAELYR